MKKALSTLTLSTVLLFGFSAIAADKVVVIPLGGKKPAGDAVAADVLEGKTFSNKDDVNIPGTMANNPAVSYIPGTSDQSISEGYHNGSGLVDGATDLISSNIRAGTTIFAVSGKTEVVDTSSGTADSSDILKGHTAWVGGVELTGSTGMFLGCRSGSDAWTQYNCATDCGYLGGSQWNVVQCVNMCSDLAVSIWLHGFPTVDKICGGNVY